MMNNLLKALFAVELVLILIAVALAIADDKNQELPTAYAVKNPGIENISFRLLTKAVCEEKFEHTICHDELFIKCGDVEYIIDDNLNNIVECNNIKLNLSDVVVNGTTMFKKEWIDSRKTKKSPKNRNI